MWELSQSLETTGESITYLHAIQDNNCDSKGARRKQSSAGNQEEVEIPHWAELEHRILQNLLP